MINISFRTIAFLALCVSGTLFYSSQGMAAIRGGVRMLPLNCSELLPDSTPFVEFLTAVGQSQVEKDRSFSRRIFRVIALRKKLYEENDWIRDHNPIDLLIQKTLCFFRIQKDPISPISYDNPEILKFLKESLDELEAKVDEAIFDTEFESEERKRYEKQIERNAKLIRTVEGQAQREANKEYGQITKSAKRKAQKQ